MSSDDFPTLANVLPEYSRVTDMLGARATKPSNEAYALGARAAVWGGSRCPWCDSKAAYEGHGDVAVCEKNPKHLMEWLPWPG